MNLKTYGASRINKVKRDQKKLLKSPMEVVRELSVADSATDMSDTTSN